MRIREFETRTLASVAALVLLLATVPALAEETMEANQAAIDACAEVINSHFERTYPKARQFAWDLSRLTVEDSLLGGLLKGGGNYRGKGGKRRTFDFECTWDPYAEQVTKAFWESSHHPGVVRLVIDASNELEILPGQVEEACTDGIDGLIRKNWPTYREMELVEETLDRRKTREGYLLRGEGRFLGVARNWHSYNFRCMFDGDSAEVTWKHHGKEVDE